MHTTAATQIERREAPIISLDSRQREVVCLISSETPDRYGSVLKQGGIHFDSQSLPVLVNHGGPAIARTSEIWPGLHRGKPAHFAKVKFPQAGLIAAADEEYARISAGISTDWSVGFYPQKSSMRDDGVLEIQQLELVEISSVAVGAQTDAKTMAVHEAPELATRNVPTPLRQVVPAPMIAERRTDLSKVTWQDFSVLAMTADAQREYRGDLGPAKEWDGQHRPSSPTGSRAMAMRR
jgi:hypothetical protein